MASLSIKNLCTYYEGRGKTGRVKAVDGISLDVEDGEFLVLLGASGSGKTTLMRTIAGLEHPSSGEIYIGGKLANDLPPKARNISMVFQSYALYPHMSVRGNLSFPLVMERFKPWNHLPIVNSFVKRRLISDPAIVQRVDEVAAIMELTEYLDRRPGTLSGGQRQRVAVGRALVREPALYLLDEPLSNLDAVLRNQMRTEITELYRKVGKSFIYVTHDQVEAMTMGTRIVVLDKGTVQQIGTPEEIFERPANVFVARFIGTPPMNLFACVAEGGQFVLDGGSLPIPVELRQVAARGGRMLLGVRAEHLSIVPLGPGSSGLLAQVVEVAYLGAEAMVAFRLGSDGHHGVVAHGMGHARVPLGHGLRPGDSCLVQMNLDNASMFDVDSGVRINA